MKTALPNRVLAFAPRGLAAMIARMLRSLLAERDWAVPTSLTLVALAVYLLTGPTSPGGDSFVPLADAFLHGHLWIAPDRPWLELVPRPDGSQYSPFPPVPAFVLMPIVAITGSQPWYSEVPSNLTCAVLGAVNVALAYGLLRRIGTAPAPRVVLTIGFAFTTHWWVAGMAGTHLWAQVVATFFLLLALHAGIRRRWPLAAGLALGLAAGSRLPTGFALPLFAALYAIPGRWRPTRAHLSLAIGLAVPALIIVWYNLARFGSPLDFGYAHIPSGETGLVTDEPWFRYGLISPLYIPRELYAILLQSFEWRDTAPFLIPASTGLALTLSAPFLFWAVRARGGARAGHLAGGRAGHAPGPHARIVGIRPVRLSIRPRCDPAAPSPSRLGIPRAGQPLADHRGRRRSGHPRLRDRGHQPPWRLELGERVSCGRGGTERRPRSCCGGRRGAA